MPSLPPGPNGAIGRLAATRALFDAALAGDAAAARGALELGGDPDPPGLDAWSNPRGGGALAAAASSGDVDCINLLLPLCDPRRADLDGRTPLMAAISSGHQGAALCLLPVSDAGAANRDGLTALMLAADAGSALLTGVLSTLSDPSARDRAGSNALMAAAKRGRSACAALLAPLSDLGARDERGRTALVIACQLGHAPAARVLVDAGSPLEAVDAFGLGALAHCGFWGRSECAALLLGAGASLWGESRRGSEPTALDYACTRGHAECARAMLDALSSWARSQALGPALAASAKAGRLDCARALLDFGAPRLDGSALCAAASRGDLEMAELLVSRGVDPDWRGDGGVTPLMAAAENGRLSMCETLLPMCDSLALDAFGRAAAEAAESSGHPRLGAFLRGYSRGFLAGGESLLRALSLAASPDDPSLAEAHRDGLALGTRSVSSLMLD